MKKKQQRHVFIVFSIVSLVLIILFYQRYSCLPVPRQVPEMSTHGYEVWANSSYRSFVPGSERFCVAKDWQSLGESSIERGGVRFPEGSTGIVIKSEDFITMPVSLEKSDFDLSVTYLKAMPEAERNAYVEIIKKAFNDVGSLYPSSTHPPQKHTVLISVGLAGDGNQFETSVYPNPSQYVSVFAKNRNHPRAEELFIHGATHAYNRFHPEFKTYQDNQSPLPAGDFEEMEATWTELTFRSSKDALETRIDDLYRTYTAVMDNRTDETILYPLSDKEIFEGIKNKSVIVSAQATEGEAEFGHYILAPLVMLAAEGMLDESTVTIDSIIAEIHRTNENFFSVLSQHVDQREMSLILEFVEGRTVIPEDLIRKGEARLSIQKERP